MPSKKSIDQAISWLTSLSSDKNSLDGINAQVCLNVIFSLIKQSNAKGAIIYGLRKKIKELSKDNDCEEKVIQEDLLKYLDSIG